ncbi:hypothetical protein HYU17_02005 [Candidatus Woesearchaeota archaeon]|nr:hypothetical protein [Candidatus Woesearchaeota archaeon]
MGMGMMGPRKPVSLILGLVFLAFGIIPLLNQFKVIGFSIPALPNIVLHVISIIGAVILLWDAISEGSMGMAMGIGAMLTPATFIMALALLAIGLIPLLNSLGVIGFNIPQLAQIIMNVLYVATGGLLLYGGTQGM